MRPPRRRAVSQTNQRPEAHTTMIKVGFIDHHLKNYHADVFLSLLRGVAGAGRVEVVGALETDPAPGGDWCAENGVTRFASAAELVNASDAVIVLAPDNIATHLALGRPAYESGKPVFVDKYLSTSLADARAIVALCAKHNTPLMSSSALRFAAEVEEVASKLQTAPDTVFARGFGNWHGYGVHTIAPAIRLFGPEVKRLVDTGAGPVRLVTLDDGKGRRATIEVRDAENRQEATPWQVGALSNGRYEFATITKFAEFYENLMRAVVLFFETRQSPVSVEEQLLTCAIEQEADASLAAGSAWVNLSL
jgi:hypothetical protein